MDHQTRYYNYGMTQFAVAEAYQELADSAVHGYKEKRNYVKFVLDVKTYLWSIADGANKPNALRLLRRRAKNHHCLEEFDALRARFAQAVTLRRFNAGKINSLP